MAYPATFRDLLLSLVGKNVTITTNTSLAEGLLVTVADDVVQLVETVVGYENETKRVVIPIASINYIRSKN
ncbi:hypothetical protein A374_03859 [Fictibacillus macauensis ZFHKF-1]|uniref:DUF2642 domain-containing protein n=1 Tax=Fictibacillus macauensis ZFHKF-1 TaxID=1196324 RepID=I8J4H6_9BACL|nr:hypothetical protein [Fictibacillus macauensis]EIT86676.1 hypothetical protein A374_03859 [Fictibacillus macauensis ZFHKF-1]